MRLSSLYYPGIALIVIFFIMLGFSSPTSLGPIRIFTVQTGSMEPTIPKGSLLITKPTDAYKVGDVITFYNQRNASLTAESGTTTHRVHEVAPLENTTHYITKGDANEIIDPSPVAHEFVVGKALFHAPKMGSVFDAIRKSHIFDTLIVGISLLIIGREVWSIRKILTGTN